MYALHTLLDYEVLYYTLVTGIASTSMFVVGSPLVGIVCFYQRGVDHSIQTTLGSWSSSYFALLSDE